MNLPPYEKLKLKLLIEAQREQENFNDLKQLMLKSSETKMSDIKKFHKSKQFFDKIALYEPQTLTHTIDSANKILTHSIDLQSNWGFHFSNNDQIR